MIDGQKFECNIEIKRDIISTLLKWKQRSERKPLIIQGARQIGKTWIMRQFGEEYFDYVAYFNFDASEELCREFENTKSPERLIDILRLYTEYPIEPERTLIIFDEIQQSNKALNSLKYFCEEASKRGLPLSAYDDLSAFKIYLCDGGLLRVMANFRLIYFGRKIRFILNSKVQWQKIWCCNPL